MATDQPFNCEAVQQHSPGSRSAPWVTVPSTPSSTLKGFYRRTREWYDAFAVRRSAGKLLDLVARIGRIKHDLRLAIPIAQVHKDAPAMIAIAIDPATKGSLL